MSKVRVTVGAESKARAQHLAAEFALLGFQIEPADRSDADRSPVLEVAKEAAIVFVVHGAYDAVKEVVSRWLDKEKISPSQVDVEPEHGGSDSDSPQGQS